MAVWAIRRDDHVAFRRGIAVTLLLGITFLLMQAYDYTVLFSEGLSMGATPFGTTYFTLTGFHGAHVFGGALMLGVVLYRAMAGQFTSKHHDMVEATSLYWHFVDVVWIILFLTLYVL
jgi:heme/copper-type cytochrome/quinol oxidase subunit 3